MDLAKILEELFTGVNVTSEPTSQSMSHLPHAKLLPFFNRLGKGGDELQVYRGNCIGHSTKGSVVYAGMDMTTGELCAITEWTFKVHTTKDKSNIQNITNQIRSLEQEINRLIQLQHPNLVRYLDVKYLENEDATLIYVLQEFVIGTSCSFFLAENIPVDIDLLRYLATGILLALKFLHENNVVHKDLRDTSIYIDRTGTVKVSDYSLNKRLSDIYQTYTLLKPEQEFPSIQGRGRKKADIYRFGALMFSLLNGVIASGDKIDPTTITQPDLQDFLLKCLTNDERKRWSAEQLLQHTFIKAPLVRALSPPKVPRRDEQKNHEPEETDTDIRQYLPPLGGHSRITNEFEVLEWLGKGAFGDVLKVKNKLDGRIYAIKRIELDPKNEQRDWKITREVKSLSRMTHKNVVRYYNSWIENATDDMENLPDSGEDNSDESMVTGNVKDIACGIDFSDSIEFEKDSNCQETVSSTKEDETGDRCSSKATVRKIQFMCIQMEFCKKSTLRTAIENDLYKNQKRVWRLFREIVEGLAHIHQQGIIHRDLKPVNIFLNSNDHVKIGDFGLARNILFSFVPTMATDKEPQVFEKGVSFSTEDIGSLTEQVGTALYVAPELATKAPYDQKVDIYSLGIIFFEMCYKPPATGMERIKILLNLRLKEIIIPTEMLQTDMQLQIHNLRWLLNHDPNQRPTAQEIRSRFFRSITRERKNEAVGKNYLKKAKGK